MKMKEIVPKMLIIMMVFGVFYYGCSTTQPTNKSMLELEEELDYDMRIRAIELAKARHRNSDFERINRIDTRSQTNGDIRFLTNTYKVFVRGNILGIIGNEVEVIVTGEINIRSNNVRILDAKIIN